MELTVKVLSSITEIDPDFLTDHSNDPICSYDWLLSIERSLPIKISPRHIIVTNGQHVVAALPCFLQFEELYSTVEDRIFGRIKPWVHRLGFGLFPALLAYVPLMYKSALIIDDHADEKEIINCVLAAMDNIARREGAKIYGFSYLPPSKKLFAALLQEKSIVSSMAVPTTYIDIQWDSFDGYIGYLKKSHRHMAKNVKREIKKNKNAGITIEKLKDFSHLTDDFASLFFDTYYRHTQKRSPLTGEFFQGLSSRCRGTAYAYCAFNGDDLRAFSIVLEGKEIWHSLLSGQNYEADQHDRSFFNVVFYEPIREAIQKKARRIYFGPANYQAKLRRGCLIEPLSMYLKSPGSISNKFLSGWLQITDMWYQRKYRDLMLRHDE